MGDSSGNVISAWQDRELGDAFYRSLHNQIKISYDPELQDYIQSIGHRIAANSDKPSNPFHFFIVMENGINAFAGPGGYIGVNAGLIMMTESESELASVMAHEVAHVTQRHLHRAFEAAGKLTLPTAAAMLAAILIGTQSPEAGQAALVAIQAGSLQYQIDFTRDNEQEADRIGMKTLKRSKFDPRSMPVFFERLQQSSRFYGKGPPEFLRTHPVTASRIADTRNRSETYPYQQVPDTFDYQLIKAKLRVLSSSKQFDNLKYFKGLIGQGTVKQKVVANYGLGLAYSASHQYPEALTIFKDLVKKYPNQIHFVAANARALLASGQPEAALIAYRKLQNQFPGNSSIKLELGSVLLKQGKAKQARQILQPLLYEKSINPDVYEHMAQASRKLDQEPYMHRYMAEYYYANGQTIPAITQIKLAQKSLKQDPYLEAILDERLNFFLNEELERRKRGDLL
ncbi:MAG: M48 family metalloprotease [Methylococcaceae bacterium]